MRYKNGGKNARCHLRLKLKRLRLLYENTVMKELSNILQVDEIFIWFLQDFFFLVAVVLLAAAEVFFMYGNQLDR